MRQIIEHFSNVSMSIIICTPIISDNILVQFFRGLNPRITVVVIYHICIYYYTTQKFLMNESFRHSNNINKLTFSKRLTNPIIYYSICNFFLRIYFCHGSICIFLDKKKLTNQVPIQTSRQYFYIYFFYNFKRKKMQSTYNTIIQELFKYLISYNILI